MVFDAAMTRRIIISGAALDWNGDGEGESDCCDEPDSAPLLGKF